jgi:hypothetical protein
MLASFLTSQMFISRMVPSSGTLALVRGNKIASEWKWGENRSERESEPLLEVGVPFATL